MNTRLLVGLSLLLSVACQRKAAPEATQTATQKEGAVIVDEGCGHGEGPSCHNSAAQTPEAQETGSTLYGAALGSSPELSLSALLSDPDSYHAKTVRVSGHVKRACSRKGCWMELAVSDAVGAASCRVKFKDYAFFVPTDSEGSSAKLEGLVQVTQVKKAAVQHYESEGATFPNKNEDGSAREIRLVATGVELTRS